MQEQQSTVEQGRPRAVEAAERLRERLAALGFAALAPLQIVPIGDGRELVRMGTWTVADVEQLLDELPETAQ